MSFSSNDEFLSLTFQDSEQRKNKRKSTGECREIGIERHDERLSNSVERKIFARNGSSVFSLFFCFSFDEKFVLKSNFSRNFSRFGFNEQRHGNRAVKLEIQRARRSSEFGFARRKKKEKKILSFFRIKNRFRFLFVQVEQFVVAELHPTIRLSQSDKRSRFTSSISFSADGFSSEQQNDERRISFEQHNVEQRFSFDQIRSIGLFDFPVFLFVRKFSLRSEIERRNSAVRRNRSVAERKFDRHVDRRSIRR